MKTVIWTGLLTVMAVVIWGCVNIPREAVTLSAKIEEDMAELHRANRELAAHYFARSKADVESFIDKEYTPFIIQDSMRRLNLLARLQEKTNESEQMAFAYMKVFVEQTLARIEQTRSELLIPLEEQERDVLRSIDDAYAGVINAQAVVTGYLGSVQKVQQAQNDFLDRAGVGDLRDNLIDQIANTSDRIAEVTEKATRGEEAAEDALNTLRSILGAGK